MDLFKAGPSYLMSILLTVILFVSCKNEKPAKLDAEIKAIENGLMPAIQIKGEPLKQFSLTERMDHYKVPGVSIAVVRNGKLHWAKGYGVANTETGQEVDAYTLFQAGSISKPLAALSALKLAEEGIIDLDEDVNNYLKNWKVSGNEFTKDEKVTLRRLLTHTAGMTVHGFPGYLQGDTFPSVETVLNGKGNTPAILVDTVPGSIWRYSGGGYTVMQKLVEDVSGVTFEEFMDENILQPLGMSNSTYEQPLPAARHASASAAYDNEGKIIDGLWHNYPEKAAAGLWTTPSDLAKYCLEIQQILSGKKEGILSEGMVADMLTKHKNDWGLGPALKNEGDSLIFQHGGKNAGFTNNMVSFARQGDAVIIMTNADNGGRLNGELLRGISGYYNWGISDPVIIETIELASEDLKKFTGIYQYTDQVPGVGDYKVEIKIEHDKLTVIDTNENARFDLIPLEELKFIDIEKGDEILFQEDGDSQSFSFLWNDRFQFNRVD